VASCNYVEQGTETLAAAAIPFPGQIGGKPRRIWARWQSRCMALTINSSAPIAGAQCLLFVARHIRRAESMKNKPFNAQRASIRRRERLMRLVAQYGNPPSQQSDGMSSHLNVLWKPVIGI